MPPSHPQSGKLHSELLVEFGLAVASAGVCLLFAFSPLSLGIVLAVVFVYITIRWTDFLFYTMLAMSPLIFWLPYNLPVRDLATIAHLGSMLGIALVRLAKRRSILQWLFGVRFNWLVCIYAVVAVISLLHSGNFTESAQRSLLRLGSYIAFYLAIVGWLQTEDQLRKTVLALLGSTLAVSVFGIFQELAGDYTPIYWWFYTADAAQARSGSAAQARRGFDPIVRPHPRVRHGCRPPGSAPNSGGNRRAGPVHRLRDVRQPVPAAAQNWSICLGT